MTSRERIEAAWDFREPDRVPFELYLMPEATQHPATEHLQKLIETYADSWIRA